MDKSLLEKLIVLSDAAKYDVSCSSSGIERKNSSNKLGNSRSFGICHSWSSDGRCISLLKILLTNKCIYNCIYCINRVTNDVKRASFSAEEIAKLTVDFYRRNYIEGLFLSSAIEENPNHTMEKIYSTLLLLRRKYNFNGYIHIKAIPGADRDLIDKCGYLTDRMSINIELPSRESLEILAPQKNINNLLLPMNQIKNNIEKSIDERKHLRNYKKFVPAGQSTQLIVGASNDSDLSIITASELLYKKFNLKRVFYSAYVPTNNNPLLPSLNTKPPLLREHRLYQADWLLRFYNFEANELLDNNNRFFDLDFDPKMNWALNNLHLFPIDINKAPFEMLLRVPGIGHISAYRIIKERKIANISFETLKLLGCVIKRAKFFITCKGKYYGNTELDKKAIINRIKPKDKYEQLSFLQ